MSLAGIKVNPQIMPQNGVEKLKRQTSLDMDAEKTKLRKATREFESFFMYQLLKTMRSTVPKSTLNDDGVFSGDMGKEVFTDMFDIQLAKKMVTGNKKSISELLYHSLEKLVEAQFNSNAADKELKIKPLLESTEKSINIKKNIYKKIPVKKINYPLKSDSEDFLPISNSIKPIKSDDILSRFGEYIKAASNKTSLDPALIVSVIKAESNGNPDAVSSAGAKGLMQLLDSTASQYEVKNQFNPEENINAGSQYLKDLIDRFGSLRLALAAYNAGPSNVMRYNGIPPFKETEIYVEKVLDTLNTINRTVHHNSIKVRY